MIPMARTKAAATPVAKVSRGLKKSNDQPVARLKRAAMLLKQVSDPTRLQVILMLSDSEQHVGGLCAELNQSQPAVSHHLALLRHGGIISPRRQGKNNFYSLTDQGGELAKVVKGVISQPLSFGQYR
jgi:DNA-binding transcriptional ArsR family regulator